MPNTESKTNPFIPWIGIFLIYLFSSWAFSLTPFGRDDSDAEGWGGGRSGVTRVTDALTGCQYLRTGFGGITPRLDARGRQVGCRQ